MAEDDEKVRRRAYEIWEKAGRPEGRHDEHWSQARKEMETYGAPEGADVGKEGGASGAPAPQGSRPGTGMPTKPDAGKGPRG